MNVPEAKKADRSLSLLFIAPFLWAMGEKAGMPSVYLPLEGFARAGHRVHLVLPEDAEGSGRVYHPGMQIHPFKWLRAPVLPLRFIGLALQKLSWVSFVLGGTITALRLSRKIKPDAVYGITSYGAPAGYIIARSRRIPNFTRLFGTFLFPFLGSRIRLLSCFDEALAFKLPCAALIVTDDGTLGDKVAARLRIPLGRVRFWRNGVEDAFFNPLPAEEELSKLRQSLGIAPDRKVVLTASRLVRWKRLDRLIRCIPEVIAKNPEALFLIIGEGAEKGYLENMARELGAAGHTLFAGAMPRSRMPDMLRIADIFVSLNDLSNVSNSLLEALACGRCVLTLNTGGTGGVIQHRVNGVLLEKDDPSHIAAALCELLGDDALRMKLARQAAGYARRNLQTWGQRVAREVRFVEDICDGWKHG